MSERNPPEASEIVVDAPVPSVTMLRERVIDVVIPLFAIITAGLVFVLYNQLKEHKPEYSASEIIINLGLLFVILAIAVSLIRISVRRYSGPPVIIPEKDRQLLEELIRTENNRAVELYVRLASFGGPTGTATKLGLTGLPLATIGLTIFFSLVALFLPVFLDLAKLTLGAFIGSFVQRSGEAIERAVRAGAPGRDRGGPPDIPTPA